MKTIGLIGGMSWVSTQDYYQIINEEVAKRVGGSASASILLHSLNFAPIESAQAKGDWQELGALLAASAQKLETAGADCILICANTMHKLAPSIKESVKIPLIHIADATAQAVKSKGLTRVTLLGTRYTMEQPFLINRLTANGITIDIPDDPNRTIIHDIIYNELIHNTITDQSRQKYLQIIEKMYSEGSQGAILGCTEIELLINQTHTAIPLFPTTDIHAKAAVDFALN